MQVLMASAQPLSAMITSLTFSLSQRKGYGWVSCPALPGYVILGVSSQWLAMETKDIQASNQEVLFSEQHLN